MTDNVCAGYVRKSSLPTGRHLGGYDAKVAAAEGGPELIRVPSSTGFAAIV
jgi:hypothetical protein